ncbi:MAG: DUF502 domain-containing protein [bacterium]|nr:DUF502 domain-containing protein [bacterium]
MSVANKILDTIKRHFISGVLVVVPLILTFIVLRFLFEAVDGILEPILHNLLGYYRTGLGLVTTLLVILLAGLLTRNFLGRRLYRLGDRLLVRVPLVRPIYSASKQLLEALTRTNQQSFKEVALIEYPRKGVFQLCFVSRRINIRTGDRSSTYITCFVPSTPTPVSGMVVVVPVDEVMTLDMTVEEGIKFLVSGGVASPDLLTGKSGSASTTSEGFSNEAG